jgi:hypothetical protein
MAQRDNRRLDMHQSAAGPPGRCPVQSSTPLGPDQVNVIIIIRPLQYVSSLGDSRSCSVIGPKSVW